MHNELTIGEFLIGTLPRLRDDKKLPWWPPDSTGGTLEAWAARARALGEKWRTSGEFPDDLAGEWQTLCQSFGLPLTETSVQRSLCEALMTLAAVADEACKGMGVPKTEALGELGTIADVGTDLLTESGTLGLDIDRSRLRVLPRTHTPQNGLTERSLSHYVCLCDASEVTPQWLLNSFLPVDAMNLLLIPWPFEVDISQFRETADATARLPKAFGFFTFTNASPENLTARVEALHAEAKRKLGRIDGVILPELSITDEQFRAIRKSLPQDCFVVAGVVGREAIGQRGTNEVWLSFPRSKMSSRESTTHGNWTKVKSFQYGLGGVLSPYREWWEHIDCTGRRLNFISISENLVMCALVCEDLARPDPVASIVRAVGPNLLIALLMDGPQTKERWAARYATVLADDPGCSVLALTSRGMAQLSRPESGPSRSQVVALWKDRFKGATEIELPQGHEAIAVSLSIRYREEFTADGRGDGGSAAFPILAGVHPISAIAASKPR
jgi:hypothetical protein